MSDFISREAAIKLFNFAVLDCLGMEPTIRAGDIIKALESIPAADVRPVVLCRDCKHNNACLTQAFVEDESRVPFDRNTFFCADGKRAES